MANIKVSEMTEATSFDNGDYTMIVQANQNKKISKENIFSNLEDEISTNSSNISVINTNIGTLSNLETPVKTNIVNSINSLIPNILYSNSQGTTSAVSLNDTAVNYDYIDIFYSDTDNSFRTERVYNPNNKNACLLTIYPTSKNYIKTKVININGTDITNVAYSEIVITNNASPTFVSSNNIKIYYVIGYKAGLFSNGGE